MLHGFGPVMLLHLCAGVEGEKRHGETGHPRTDYANARLGTGLAEWPAGPAVGVSMGADCVVTQ